MGNKENPNGAYGVTGMIMNSEDVTMTANNTKSKKSRKQRRGSKEGNKSSGSNAGAGGPRHSSSTSSQLSQMTGSNSLTEDQEQLQPSTASTSLRNQNILEESQNSSSNNTGGPGGVIPAASAALTTTQLQTNSKVKSAETNVKVSLQIVNEVENVHNVSNNSNNTTRKSNESLDIVDEELAKMAVAESLTDIPLEIDSTRIQEIDDIEDIDDDDAVVVTLPINEHLVKSQTGSLPGTPISHT